jgi:toxin ParE1/3/4
MRRDFSFHPMAEEELNEVAAYYEGESEGLGAAFLKEVEKAVRHILDYPESSPLINRLVRKKLVRRFPYNLMYSVTPKDIRILAIASQKRRPFYWRGRK